MLATRPRGQATMKWNPNPEPDPDPLSPDPNPLPSPKPPIPNPPPYPNPPVRPPIPQLVGWTHRRGTASHALLLCLAVLMVLAVLIATPVAAAPVSVRFSEGVTHVHLHAIEEQSIQLGDRSGKATQFVFTPQLGMIQEWLGTITGKLPAEFHYDCWIMVDGIPSFVQYEGPLQLLGPILRIELVSPHLHAKPDEKKISLK